MQPKKHKDKLLAQRVKTKAHYKPAIQLLLTKKAKHVSITIETTEKYIPQLKHHEKQETYN